MTATDTAGASAQPTTVTAMREWLRDWVAQATDLSRDQITDERSMQEFGLSSRDVVVLSGDLQRLTGRTLDATIAYEHNSIGALAEYLINGAGAARAGSGLGEASGANGAARGGSASGQALEPDERDIAIVGLAGTYPGAENADAMWEMFLGYRDGIGEPPADRWTEYAGEENMTQRMVEAHLTGGYIEDIASFDAEFFGLSPVEAANMDPQQRILLKLTWEALEDAHIPANRLRGTNVGVFMGTTNNDYATLITADPAEAHPYALTGNSTSIIANRISYAFDFRGPSVAMDTACSSSLVAIHQAVRSLRDGDSTVALAGGVNLLASPFATVAFSELGVLSPTGKIHAFSEDADGIVRSDGAGVVVLKRVADARRDGDEILAVIKGSAINSDGRSNGLTAPNPDAQIDVLRAAYADAGVDPRQVDYVEAHGTGTILGDPIEARALGEVLGAGRDSAHPLLLGSAKTNFGHTEAAAGVAGVIKVVQALRHGTLPASLNFAGPNPYIDWDRENLEVVEDAREWPEYSGMGVAGVSGFGFGGTNAHVVITAAEGAAVAPNDSNNDGDADSPIFTDAAEDRSHLLPISGLLPSRRRAAAQDLADWLEAEADNGQVDLAAVARTLAGRNHGRSRGVVVAKDTEEALKGLRSLAEGKSTPTAKSQDAPSPQGPVWVYSGFGSQHRKMGKELYQSFPRFKQLLDEMDQIVQAESGWSLVEKILDDEQDFDTESAQVGITCIQIALTDLLAELGLRPAAVVGQSMGEIAAGYATGGLSKDDALLIACHRSRLMGEGESLLVGDQQGAMAVVEFGVAELTEFTAAHPEFERVEPAVYAAPGMTTVGGPSGPVSKLVEHLEAEGKFARLLAVKGAGHTSMVDPILGELHFEISDVEPRPIHTPLYSTVDRGRVYQPGETVHDADYFVRCTRQPVWFAEATGKQFDEGYRTFVEISPNPVALMPLTNNSFAHDASDATLLFALKRKEPVADTLLNLIAELYVRGADADLRALETTVTAGAGYAKLPGTRWNLQRHWTAARPTSGGANALPGTKVALPDGRVAFGVNANVVPSIAAIAESVAAVLSPEAQVAAVREHGVLPASGALSIIASRNLGGWAVNVHDAEAEELPLVGEAFLSTLGVGAVQDAAASAAQNAQAEQSVQAGATTTAAPATQSTGNKLPEVDEVSGTWDPSGSQSARDRLREIVAESMGYDPEDLPGELPLIDLGLDSLMGMRIKNRVEYEFDIPPIQVQALRDGSVDDVIGLVEGMIQEHHGAQTSGAESQSTEDTEDAAAPGEEQTSDYTATAGGVAPRDASERLVFATWAKLTGAAAPGVTSTLPSISEDTATAIAERLAERSGAEITAQDVLDAETMEPLAALVRASFETDVEGNIRVLRARGENSGENPSVFLFHPAGGSSTVYAPLTRRLPAEIPVYGVERLEGPLTERAAAYIQDIIDYADGKPVILGGWSFGGALAYEVAFQLIERMQRGEESVEIERIVLLDTVQPKNPAPDTKEEMHARWDRYAEFAQRTYGLPMEVPHDLLESQGEGVMMAMFQQFLTSPEAGAMGLPAGVLEHQRASFVDNRILESLDLKIWDSVDVPVTLFRAERMHDGAIELEPAYAEVAEDGGWGEIVEDLEIVHLHGDHLAVVDEPEIATVGRVLAAHIVDALVKRS